MSDYLQNCFLLFLPEHLNVFLTTCAAFFLSFPPHCPTCRHYKGRSLMRSFIWAPHKVHLCVIYTEPLKKKSKIGFGKTILQLTFCRKKKRQKQKNENENEKTWQSFIVWICKKHVNSEAICPFVILFHAGISRLHIITMTTVHSWVAAAANKTDFNSPILFHDLHGSIKNLSLLFLGQ